MKRIGIVLILPIAVGAYLLFSNNTGIIHLSSPTSVVKLFSPYDSVPLSIALMRNKSYPGSDIVIEQTLAPLGNYNQYIVSYLSDGLKIHALLTVPNTPKPKDGFPVIVFNHGYIPPLEYRTTERYVAYVDGFARSGYIVIKPDFRGNGSSDGQPEGAYYSPAYTTDSLNALSSIKKYKDVNPQKIGVWGHSMGGNITMRSLVVDPKDIKAAVIWSGVVGSYEQLAHWHDPNYHPSAYELTLRYRYRQNIEKQYGTPESNPAFWHAIDPRYHLSDILAPLEVHQGLADEEVPPDFAQSFVQDLKKNGKTVEYFEYLGADHNLSQVFDDAMQRSVSFFDKYLK